MLIEPYSTSTDGIFVALNVSTLGTLGVIMLIILVIWQLVWDGLALWRAAQNRDKWWFIAMLLINDLGIIEILYYFIFSKKGKKAGLKEDSENNNSDAQ